MAVENALKFVLIGIDRSASKALRGVRNEAKHTDTALGKLGKLGKAGGLLLAGGLATAGVAAVKFGGDSLKAFADADKSQKQLEDAYRRFPKVANVNIETLRKYNQTLQRKTGADADDLAAAQAQLAAFKLNGKQIQSMSPLLIDYANKTGKSLPDAAKTLGKATLGNTKALKDLGISYKSTGDPAKDYANIMTLLKEKVGGYTESLPEVETKQKILQASFGDLQEAVGEKLQPAMLGLMDAGQGVLDWLDQNPKVMEGATAAWDLFSMALGGLWDIVRKLVLPGIALLNEYGIRPLVRGFKLMFEALGNVPGFEWAKGAAAKLGEVDEAIGAVDEALTSLSKDPRPVTVETEAAKKKVKDVQTKIDGIKGKIVTAKAKGDDKELKKLERQLKKAEEKKWKLSVRARAISGGGWKITGNVSGAGDRYTLKAFRQGGRPAVGRFAQFHKDEIWAPDQAGTVISQSLSRALMRPGASVALPAGSAPAAQVSRSAAGTVIENHFHVAPGANLRELEKVVDKAMTQGLQARNGRPYTWTRN